MANIRDDLITKSALTGFLEQICASLDLTKSQLEVAEERYNAIGKWLSESTTPHLCRAEIYPQGSIALGTTVKPLSAEEYDVDLVCLVPSIQATTPPKTLKKLIGDRLRDNGRYVPILEEKARCWRLNYSGEFHLDVTPSIPNVTGPSRGELVPDKKLDEWKPTNPKDYRALFEKRAALFPRIRLQEAEFAAVRAQIEELPQPSSFKGLLRRAVQISKRHRDVAYADPRRKHLAPISIILTTLAAQSYQGCAVNTYDTEFDALVDVLTCMPDYIHRKKDGSRYLYFVWNETCPGENFAEKWNFHPGLADEFYRWHIQLIRSIRGLSCYSGRDQVGTALSTTFGKSVVEKILKAQEDSVSNARRQQGLAIGAGIGLSVSREASAQVPPNTFFGD